MKTQTIYKTKDTAKNNETYQHNIKTDSLDLTICNNSDSSREDKTYLHIETENGNNIVINQLDNFIAINGNRINLCKKFNSFFQVRHSNPDMITSP